MPFVSVIMSVFNSQTFLCECIRSILEQSYENFEFIIINDASTDRSKDIINNFTDKRIIVIENIKRLGLTKSLNTGLKQSRGDYIARIDADDIANKDRLRVQIEYLQRNQDISILGSYVLLSTADGNILKCLKPPEHDADIRKILIWRNCMIHPSLMIRKKVFDLIGLYDENFIYSQDYDLCLRALHNFKFTNIPIPLTTRIIHRNMVSIERRKEQIKYEIEAKKKLARINGYKMHISILYSYLLMLVPNYLRIIKWRQYQKL